MAFCWSTVFLQFEDVIGTSTRARAWDGQGKGFVWEERFLAWRMYTQVKFCPLARTVPRSGAEASESSSTFLPACK
jgi:hypothetical protein